MKMSKHDYPKEMALDLQKTKNLSYEDLRVLYRKFLHSQDYAKTTIRTAYSDAFYLWRKGSKDLFWNTVLAHDFENTAKVALEQTFSKHPSDNVQAFLSSYLSHLRRFRLFLTSEGVIKSAELKIEKAAKSAHQRNKKNDVDVPVPSIDQVKFYLEKWNGLEDYRLQEDALNLLFFELCPKNKDITDILLKASTLNNFYSTNIFSIYPVAKHICALDIDSRLESGDVTLVRDLQYVTIRDVKKNFYSFSTKYCSHHNPLEYPIYDSYVDLVLRHFRNQDGFSNFQDVDLKDYVKFKSALIDFRAFYDLQDFNLKQIDKYLWLLGKDYFPKFYGKKKKDVDAI